MQLHAAIRPLDSNELVNDKPRNLNDTSNWLSFVIYSESWEKSLYFEFDILYIPPESFYAIFGYYPKFSITVEYPLQVEFLHTRMITRNDLNPELEPQLGEYQEEELKKCKPEHQPNFALHPKDHPYKQWWKKFNFDQREDDMTHRRPYRKNLKNEIEKPSFCTIKAKDYEVPMLDRGTEWKQYCVKKRYEDRYKSKMDRPKHPTNVHLEAGKILLPKVPGDTRSYVHSHRLQTVLAKRGRKAYIYLKKKQEQIEDLKKIFVEASQGKPERLLALPGIDRILRERTLTPQGDEENDEPMREERREDEEEEQVDNDETQSLPRDVTPAASVEGVAPLRKRRRNH